MRSDDTAYLFRDLTDAAPFQQGRIHREDGRAEHALALFREVAPELLAVGQVVRAVSEATAHKAILVTDVGQNQMFGCRYFQFSEARSVVTSGGCGTMGFGLPAAIGATFGAPERTVCMFCGSRTDPYSADV